MRRLTTSVLLALAALALAACGGGGGGPAPGPAWVQTLTEIRPAVGPTVGGTEVLLEGTGFLDPRRPVTGIRFGDTPVRDWRILDDRRIRLTTPPGRPGTVTFFVMGEGSDLGDGILLAAGFTYVTRSVFVAEDARAVSPRLLRVDVETGEYGLVGSIGFPIAAMALTPEGQDIWALEDGPLRRLIRIDPLTGIGTAVALVRDGQTDLPVELRDLTFLDGRLVGRAPSGDLVEIDRATGTTTPVPAALGPGRGLAVLPDGTVILAPEGEADRLTTWDPATDAVFDGPDLLPGAVLGALAAQDAAVYALEDDPLLADRADLLRIDPLSGEVVIVAELPPNAGALAEAP